ncbi:MAG: DUF721 domain-containing protein [Treponema sp.]|jgi:hypothetical protein|nr:DUF721 domain-containing protein [Treponema sp.]
MNKDSDIMSAADMISATFSFIENSKVEKSNKIFSVWKKTIGSVRSCGNKLLSHSRLVDLKNGILLIETDHPGWIQLMQLNKKYIINGLKKGIPELTINTLAFRLKGSTASLCRTDNNQEKERQLISERIEKEEEELSPYNNNQDKKEEIPDELQNLLDHLHSDMLTNTKK